MIEALERILFSRLNACGALGYGNCCDEDCAVIQFVGIGAI